MNKRQYEAIINHLVDYKLNVLEIEECGNWWKNNKQYPHILPEECKYENILNNEFRPELKEIIASSKLHRGFHHLNSSQALALNLFGPFSSGNKLEELNSVLNEDLAGGKGQFEYIDNAEEGTNFDFAIVNIGKPVYFEVKYTEAEFGRAKSDPKHIEKYNSIYKNRLERFCKITRDEFFRDYQLWRNIIYSDKGIVLFVLPKFRSDLIKKVESARNRLYNPKSVDIAYIDDICAQGLKNNLISMRTHFAEFQRKYLEVRFTYPCSSN
jgi:hypothetical protein